jgi:hypothetical protein
LGTGVDLIVPHRSCRKRHQAHKDRINHRYQRQWRFTRVVALMRRFHGFVIHCDPTAGITGVSSRVACALEP